MSVAAENREVIFETKLDVGKTPFLADHRWRGVTAEEHTYETTATQAGIVVPGTAYLDMALAAAMEVYGERPVSLQDVEFHQALFIPEGGTRTVQLRLSSFEDASAKFEVDSLPTGGNSGSSGGTRHVSGNISLVSENDANHMAVPALAEVRSRCKQHVTKNEHDEAFRNRGFDYGASFKVVEQLWRGENEAIGEVLLSPDLQQDASNYYMHPGVLDSCFQVGGSALPVSVQYEAYIPVAVDSYQLLSRPTARMWSHVYQLQDQPGDDKDIIVGVTIYNQDGELVARVPSLHVKRIERSASTITDRRGIDARYRIRWKKSNAYLDQEPEVSRRPVTWLIFADRSGVGEGLAKHLTGVSGNNAVLVYPGDKLRITESNRFGIVPGNEEHMEEIFEKIDRDLVPITKIVYLWGLDCKTNQLVSKDLIDPVSETGVNIVIQLLRSVSRYRSIMAPRLWLVTRGAQRIGGQTEVSLLQNPLWGLGRSIAQEAPKVWGGLLDLDPSEELPDMDTVYREIIGTDEENQIAYRSRERYVARLQRIENSQVPYRDYRLDPSGTYMITGGTGGLGRRLLQWLVRHGARHLVIITRTPLTNKVGLKEVSDDTEQHRKSDAIRSLVESGIDLHFLTGDVRDRRRLEEIFEIVRDKLPPLRGIMHVAGVLDDGSLNYMNQARFEKVMDPKVSGAWNLHTLSLDYDLEFFVLFSSIASVLGSTGQANYSAANAFLDGLAHYRHSVGLPAISINWGPWAGDGMAESVDLSKFMRLGMGALDPDYDWSLMDSVLTLREAQVVVVRMDWSSFSNSSVAIPVLRFVEDLTSEKHRSDAGSGHEISQEHCIPVSHSSMSNATSLARRPEQFAALVTKEVLLVLGLGEDQQLDTKEPLLNYGFESLMALRLKNNLENRLNCQLPDTLVFDYPSIVEIADYLCDLQPVKDMETVPELLSAPHGDDEEMEKVYALLAEVESIQDDEMIART